MGRFTDWILSGNAQTPKRLRRGGYAGVWRGLLSGLDSRADDMDALAARGMLLECRDQDLDAHLRNTRDIRLCGETDAEVRAYLAQRSPRCGQNPRPGPLSCVVSYRPQFRP